MPRLSRHSWCEFPIGMSTSVNLGSLKVRKKLTRAYLPEKTFLCKEVQYCLLQILHYFDRNPPLLSFRWCLKKHYFSYLPIHKSLSETLNTLTSKVNFILFWWQFCRRRGRYFRTWGPQVRLNSRIELLQFFFAQIILKMIWKSVVWQTPADLARWKYRK